MIAINDSNMNNGTATSISDYGQCYGYTYGIRFIESTKDDEADRLRRENFMLWLSKKFGAVISYAYQLLYWPSEGELFISQTKDNKPIRYFSGFV